MSSDNIASPWLFSCGHILMFYYKKRTLAAALEAAVSSEKNINEMRNFFNHDVKNEYIEFNLLPEEERAAISAYAKCKYNALRYIARS